MHDRTEERLASTDCGLVEANSNVRFEKDGLGVRGWRRCAARDAAASEGLSGALVRLLGPSARTLEIDGRPKDCAVACWMIRISQEFRGVRRWSPTLQAVASGRPRVPVRDHEPRANRRCGSPVHRPLRASEALPRCGGLRCWNASGRTRTSDRRFRGPKTDAVPRS